MLAACSSSNSAKAGAGPVVLATPGTPAPRTASACAAFVTSLPAELAKGVRRRPVSLTPGAVAAWGDPAVVLRCGVPAGNTLDEPYVFDGVSWAVHDDGATRRWTTFGRKVEVEVVVPDSYDAQAELLITLSPAVKRLSS